LEDIIKKHKGSILVFVRTKYGVKEVTKRLVMLSHSADEIHSNLSQNRRRTTLDAFRSGKTRILVATDVAARGLDVKGIELVINYNLPDAHADYVHRIGRTGRAGVNGKAISFATPDQLRDIAAIERLINKKLSIRKNTYFLKAEAGSMAEADRGNNSDYARKPRIVAPRRSKPNQASSDNGTKKHRGHNVRGRKERNKRFARAN
jgi:ATP-dependent RNA helicase RhlE